MNNAEYQSDDITFNADLCVVRKDQNTIPFYFARNAIKVMVGNTGVEAEKPLTIYTRGTEGTIISEGGKVSLKGAGVQNVQFEPAVTVVNSGNGFIEVELGTGTYKFQ